LTSSNPIFCVTAIQIQIPKTKSPSNVMRLIAPLCGRCYKRTQSFFTPVFRFQGLWAQSKYCTCVSLDI